MSFYHYTHHACLQLTTKTVGSQRRPSSQVWRTALQQHAQPATSSSRRILFIKISTTPRCNCHSTYSSTSSRFGCSTPYCDARVDGPSFSLGLVFSLRALYIFHLLSHIICLSFILPMLATTRVHFSSLFSLLFSPSSRQVHIKISCSSGPQVPGAFSLKSLFLRDQAASSNLLSRFVNIASSWVIKISPLSSFQNNPLSLLCYPCSVIQCRVCFSCHCFRFLFTLLLAAGSCLMVLRTVVRPGPIPVSGENFGFSWGNQLRHS